MISVEWHDNAQCKHCGRNVPHCAKIICYPFTEIDATVETSESIELIPLIDTLLCSLCVANLIKRLQ